MQDTGVQTKSITGISVEVGWGRSAAYILETVSRESICTLRENQSILHDLLYRKSLG